jgi:hypothetical protein
MWSSLASQARAPLCDWWYERSRPAGTVNSRARLVVGTPRASVRGVECPWGWFGSA